MSLLYREVWNQILVDGGSVQGIKALDDWCFIGDKLIERSQVSPGDDPIAFKEVFKTFKEINQLDLIRQAGLRQQYIDQSVSLNLAFPTEATPKWISQCHMEAWKLGIKTLYYMRTESVLRGDIAKMAMDPECLSCDG